MHIAITAARNQGVAMGMCDWWDSLFALGRSQCSRKRSQYFMTEKGFQFERTETIPPPKGAVKQFQRPTSKATSANRIYFHSDHPLGFTVVQTRETNSGSGLTILAVSPMSTCVVRLSTRSTEGWHPLSPSRMSLSTAVSVLTGLSLLHLQK